MTSVSRRAFLAGCGVIGVSAVSAKLALSPDDIFSLASKERRAVGSGVLVLVTLYGGNDGLNTLIPYTSNAYYDARPDIAYSPDEVLDLDGEHGLNPGMPGLAEVFREGNLAVIRGAGYPDQDRSHFRSMDIWQTGSVENGVTTGWVGRWLDMQDLDPIRAINIGSVLPILAVGSNAMAATLSPEHVGKSRVSSDLVTALSAPDAEDAPSLAAVRASYRAVSDVSKRFDEVLTNNAHDGPMGKPTSSTNFDSQLQAVSQCIRSGLATQVYSVSLTGFDTHANEKSTQQSLLGKLDSSLSKFLKEISDHEFGRDVVVMAYSEFGRRVAANASDGTDHGTSGPVFIAGAPVKGGFYGDDPSLTDLTQGDLKTTTDFRDVYAELLSKTLDTDPDPIVGAKRKPLGFLA